MPQRGSGIFASEQGRSQPHSCGWARVLLSSFFPSNFDQFSSSYFSSLWPAFWPSGWASRPPGKALATYASEVLICDHLHQAHPCGPTSTSISTSTLLLVKAISICCRRWTARSVQFSSVGSLPMEQGHCLKKLDSLVA